MMPGQAGAAGPEPWPGAPVPAGHEAASDVPRTKADAGVWLTVGVAGFVAGQIVAAIVLVGVAAVLGHLDDYSRLAARTVPPGWVVVSELLGLWVGFLAAVVLASRLRGTGRVAADMRLRFAWWDLLVGPLVGFGGQILVAAVYLPFERLVPNLSQRLSEPANRLTGGFPGSDLAVIACLTVLVVPVVEELLFRGVFLRSLLRLFDGWPARLGPVAACLLSGIVFGLAHFEPLQLAGLALFGAVLSALVYRTGRLGTSIVAHASFNLWAIAAVAGILPLHWT